MTRRELAAFRLLHVCIATVEHWKNGRLVSSKSCTRTPTFEVWSLLGGTLEYCSRHVSHVGNLKYTSARREDIRRIAA